MLAVVWPERPYMVGGEKKKGDPPSLCLDLPFWQTTSWFVFPSTTTDSLGKKRGILWEWIYAESSSLSLALLRPPPPPPPPPPPSPRSAFPSGAQCSQRKKQQRVKGGERRKRFYVVNGVMISYVKRQTLKTRQTPCQRRKRTPTEQ